MEFLEQYMQKIINNYKLSALFTTFYLSYDEAERTIVNERTIYDQVQFSISVLENKVLHHITDRYILFCIIENDDLENSNIDATISDIKFTLTKQGEDKNALAKKVIVIDTPDEDNECNLKIIAVEVDYHTMKKLINYNLNSYMNSDYSMLLTTHLYFCNATLGVLTCEFYNEVIDSLILDFSYIHCTYTNQYNREIEYFEHNIITQIQLF